MASQYEKNEKNEEKMKKREVEEDLRRSWKE